jgi:LPS-assembly protein
MKLQPGHLLALAIWPIISWTETAEATSDPWLLCPAVNSLNRQYIAPERFDKQKKDETRISAEKIENAAGNITTFSGDVLIKRDQLRLRADRVLFNRAEQKLSIDGQIHIDTLNMAINSDSGWLNLMDNSAEFSNSFYFSPTTRFQGHTPILSLTKNKQTLLIDSRFSTCPTGKEQDDEDWYLQTAYLQLDHEEQLGTAKHAVLWFKSVPIFYSPYINFPLGDERRSGFLMPSFGRSDSRGTEISIPWYWNIAPNQDALLTPRYMQKRGTLLSANYRYLTQASNGKLDIEYLPKDRILKEKRYLIKFNNHSNIGENIDFDITANDASDNKYFNDLGLGINIVNITHLQRSASVKYFSGPWNLNALAQTYKTIDDNILLSKRPYRRLPKITLQGKDSFSDSAINWSLDSEWVDFKHESKTNTSGSRFDFHPKLSWPLQGSAWFFTPTIGYRHSQYNLTDGNDTKLNIKQRNVSVNSLDTGLFFERTLSNKKTIQTLEPRLFYLHAPFREQSNIPLFDTGEYDFSFAQLFRDNRFSGIDRIADSNQLSFALSSRFLSKETGKEFFSMSIGQIFYNQDRKVNLTNNIQTQSQSDIVSEINGHWNNWNSKLSLQWNHELSKIDKSSAQLNYRNNGNRIFNLGYRFRRNFADESKNLEQTNINFSWPLSRQYSLLGKWNYSITEQRDIEVLFGIEYESCCWAMRIVSQRYLQNTTDPNADPYNSSLMFQLILKGLGSVAHKQTTDVLKRAILGYQSEY